LSQHQTVYFTVVNTRDGINTKKLSGKNSPIKPVSPIQTISFDTPVVYKSKVPYINYDYNQNSDYYDVFVPEIGEMIDEDKAEIQIVSFSKQFEKSIPQLLGPESNRVILYEDDQNKDNLNELFKINEITGLIKNIHHLDIDITKQIQKIENETQIIVYNYYLSLCLNKLQFSYPDSELVQYLNKIDKIIDKEHKKTNK